MLIDETGKIRWQTALNPTVDKNTETQYIVTTSKACETLIREYKLELLSGQQSFNEKLTDFVKEVEKNT